MTLDEDVAALLKRLSRLRRQRPGIVVNPGASLIGSLDDVEGVLARTEGHQNH